MLRDHAMSGKCILTSLLFVLGSFALLSPLQLRAAGPVAEVVGRVLNANTGNYLNNARVSVAGKTLQVFTDESGRYRLADVPAGEVRLLVSYTGLYSESVVLTLAANEIRRQDFELAIEAPAQGQKGVVVMDTLTVSDRVLSGQALALNEQRYAPNIKTVVSLDEFPDMGEGAVGEFLKHVPGMALDYNPQSPVSASIRGMPASGTVVTVDGMAQASSGAYGRGQDLSSSASGNIDRIEISKVPTPDMPANAVGGGVNLITKNGFGRKTPLLTYSVFGTYTALDGIESPGWDSSRVARSAGGSSASRIYPAFNISYLRPVNDSLAFSVSLSKSQRYNDWQYLRPTWNKVSLQQTNYGLTHIPLEEMNLLGSASVDWRINSNNSVRLSFQHSTRDATLRQHSVTSTPGAGATGGPEFAQGASTGVGNIAQGFGWNNQHRPLDLWSGSYKYESGSWKFDLSGSYSTAGISLLDTDDGFFSNVGANITNLVVRNDRHDLSSQRRIPIITALTRTGAPVAVYDGGSYSINSASASNRRIDQEVVRGAFNLSRDFEGSFPVTIKVGASVERLEHLDASAPKSWTFTPPGGAAGRTASNYDVIDEAFSSAPRFTDANGNDVSIRFLSPTKLFQLYQANPSWFVLNAPAAHTGEVNGTKDLSETISAAYVRGDLRLLDNRLWLVAGVRFEKTTDDGRGPLDDIRATYAKDPNGNVLLNNGNPVPISTDPLEIAKLRYTLLGSRTKKSYDGYYPSVNSSFAITQNLVVRAAYAKTIGRPNFTEIIPSVVAASPTVAEANRTVTVINTGLRPWSSDNFDLTLEAYKIKGAVASVSLFRKDITDFFGQTRTDATRELLAEFGLGDEYLDYDIVTKRNAGDAALNGVEFSWRQSFDQIHRWGRGLQLYVNFTAMELSGANKDDFSNFVPFTINFGASYTRQRYRFDISVNQFNERRIAPTVASATVGPGSYAYNPSQSKVDLSLEYRINRRLSIFGTARNLNATPLRRGTWSDATPGYARVDQYQFTGAMFTFGVKGRY